MKYLTWIGISILFSIARKENIHEAAFRMLFVLGMCSLLDAVL